MVKVVIDEERCNGCGNCAAECDEIKMNTSTDLAEVVERHRDCEIDICGLACINACPVEAITIVDEY